MASTNQTADAMTAARNSPAVRRALARFWTRMAELATTPEARERACNLALDALDKEDLRRAH